MSLSRTDLPAPSAPNFEQRVRETLMTYLGRQGSPFDRGLTVRDLVDAGIISLRPGTQIGPGTLPIDPGDAFDTVGTGGSTAPDLTPPPAPTGFSLTPAISSVMVQHDAPTYTQGRGHFRTRVYATTYTSGPLPTIASAVEVGQFTGNLWALVSNPATTWRVWIRWETRDGVIGPPAGGTNGLAATTGQDVSTLLQALAGQISESQLANALGSRINLIDAPVTGLVTQVGNANAAIQQEAIVRGSVDDGLLAQFTVKVDVAGHVSGYGLASTVNNATPTSDFLVRADRFAVMPPAIVQSTAPTANRYRGMVWRDTSVFPAVTRYWTGSAWTTTPQVLPFAVVTSSATINGVTVGPGVYIDTAFIASATVTRAQIGSVDADTVQAGFMQAVDFSGSTLIGSELFIGGTPSYEYNFPGQPTRISGVASVSNPNIALRTAGAEFAVTHFAIKNGGAGTPDTVFEVSGGNVRIKQAYLRGLAVVDNAGNVLFGAGTALSVSNISGLGSLATQNSVTTGQVSGLGAFATLSLLTGGNISTYIQSGAIGTAFIGTAAITTALIDTAAITNVKIADGAVDSLKIANQIRSDNFVFNSAGWAIDKTGVAQFSAISVRGASIVERLTVTGTVTGSVFVANNSTSTVTHNENRNIVLSIWSTAGSATLTDNGLNSFTVRLDNSSGGLVFYKYF